MRDELRKLLHKLTGAADEEEEPPTAATLPTSKAEDITPATKPANLDQIASELAVKQQPPAEAAAQEQIHPAPEEIVKPEIEEAKRKAPTEAGGKSNFERLRAQIAAEVAKRESLRKQNVSFVRRS